MLLRAASRRAVARGLPAPARASMAFAAGAYVFPGGMVDDATPTAVTAGPARAGRAGAGRSARAEAWPGRWSARRSGRRSRSPACCWPGLPPDTVVADTTGDEWEADRQALSDRLAVAGRAARPARAGAARRPAAALGALDHPGGRAAPLRHPVLRRRPARGPAHPATSAARPTTWLAAAGRRDRGRAAGEMSMLPPTAATLSELAACGSIAAVMPAARPRPSRGVPSVAGRRRPG